MHQELRIEHVVPYPNFKHRLQIQRQVLSKHHTPAYLLPQETQGTLINNKIIINNIINNNNNNNNHNNNNNQSIHKEKFESDTVSWWFGYKAKPFTDYSPKALIPIHGRPAIDHLARYLSRFSCVSEIIIECEFDSFGKQIINYFEGKEELLAKESHSLRTKRRERVTRFYMLK